MPPGGGGEQPMGKHPKTLTALASALLLSAITTAAAITYLSDEEALALAFGKDARIERVTRRLTPEGQARYYEALGVHPDPQTEYLIYAGWKENEPLGYAYVLTESSRYRPITFLVALTPQGAVSRVEVMAYREPRGGEVKKRRFLEQYEGARENLQLGRDVLSISGATVSAQVMTFGVNKAIFLTREFFLSDSAEKSDSQAKAAP